MNKYVSLFLLVCIAALSGYLLYSTNLQNVRDEQRERDVVRLSNMSDIRHALDAYKDQFNTYPPCLYKRHTCTSLEGTSIMPLVPRDVLTNAEYNYAAIGGGALCTSYHLGASLERTLSQALLTTSDDPPVKRDELCDGSEADFSGLSYAPGGHKCDLNPGIAQPTTDARGETCYDIKP